MSFTGSLVLAGVGGLVYKFAGGQSYEKLPAVDIPFNEFSDKVYKKHFTKVVDRTKYILMNFFKVRSPGAPSYTRLGIFGV